VAGWRAAGEEWGLRNPPYHTPGDTAETLDYERMAGVVDGVLNAVRHIAG
jgi:hypothetical protein